MALELEGTLLRKLDAQSGTSARGAWSKQEFILEFPDGNFTSQACFTAWGSDKVAELGRFQAGDRIKVSFNLKSREYNGRWYNDLQIWRIAPVGEAAPAAPSPQAAPAPVYQSAPAPAYTPSPENPAPAPGLEDMPGETKDDLPF